MLAARSHQSQPLAEMLNPLSATLSPADSYAVSGHESLETALCILSSGVVL